jgi:hypothetical protein
MAAKIWLVFGLWSDWMGASIKENILSSCWMNLSSQIGWMSQSTFSNLTVSNLINEI